MLDFGAHDRRQDQLAERALGVGIGDELLPRSRCRAATMQRCRCSVAVELNGAKQSIGMGCMLLARSSAAKASTVERSNALSPAAPARTKVRIKSLRDMAAALLDSRQAGPSRRPPSLSSVPVASCKGQNLRSQRRTRKPTLILRIDEHELGIFVLKGHECPGALGVRRWRIEGGKEAAVSERSDEFGLLQAVAALAPKAAKRALRQMVGGRSWSDHEELELIARAQRFDDLLLVLGDRYVLSLPEVHRVGLFGSFVPDRDKGLRCNEIIDPQFDLNDTSLRRLFMWTELLMRLSLSLMRDQEINRHEMIRPRDAIDELCASLPLEVETQQRLHRMFDVRVDFGHTPIGCREIEFCNVTLSRASRWRGWRTQASTFRMAWAASSMRVFL